MLRQGKRSWLQLEARFGSPGRSCFARPARANALTCIWNTQSLLIETFISDPP